MAEITVKPLFSKMNENLPNNIIIVEKMCQLRTLDFEKSGSTVS